MLLKTTKRDGPDGEWYTPAFLGNRELPEVDRVEIEIFAMTKREKDELERSVITNGRSRDWLKSVEDRTAAKVKRAIETKIGRIKRLSIDEKSVESGSDLWKALDDLPAADAEEILEEALRAISDRSVLEEGLLGNSR